MRAMIFCKDLARMVEFYQQTMGLQLIEETRMKEWVEFQSGSTRFSLHAIPEEIARTIVVPNPPKPRESGSVKLSFEVPNEAAEAHRLETLGVMILRRPWGSCDVVDPEGNVIGLYAQP